MVGLPVAIRVQVSSVMEALEDALRTEANSIQDIDHPRYMSIAAFIALLRDEQHKCSLRSNLRSCARLDWDAIINVDLVPCVDGTPVKYMDFDRIISNGERHFTRYDDKRIGFIAFGARALTTNADAIRAADWLIRHVDKLNSAERVEDFMDAYEAATHG